MDHPSAIKKLLLFPFNGNTREALAVVNALNSISPQWQTLGFVDDDPQKKGLTFGSCSVLGNRSVFLEYPDAYILACPGRAENFHKRSAIINSLNIANDRFASIVHPRAVVGVACNVGNNSLIMANVVLTAAVTVGSNVVILPNTVISHDTAIGEWSIIGSNVSISGGVTIGKNCYIGTGARIISDVSVGNYAMVGMGSVVIRNIQASSVVAGNPAKNLYEN